MQDDKLSIPNPDNKRRSVCRVRTLLLLAALLVAAGGGYWWFDNLDTAVLPSDDRNAPGIETVPPSPENSVIGAADGTGKPHAAEESARELSAGIVAQDTGVAAGEALESAAMQPPSKMQPVQTLPADATNQNSGERMSSVENAGGARVPIVSGTEMRLALASRVATPPASEGRQDDAVVSSRFTGDLARWMVQGYHLGKGGKGYLAVGLPAANMHYASTLKGFNWSGDNLYAGRQDILSYVFSSGMLNGLYRLYVDRFLQNLDAAAAARSLTEAQMQDMYALYARQFNGLAGVLDGLADIPDLAARLGGLTALANVVAEADTRYGMLTVERERAKMAGDADRARALGKEVNQAMRAYQQAVQQRERETRSLIKAVKRNEDARIMDDSAILFVASWVGRRFDRREDIQAVQAAAGISADLARRLMEKAHP